MYNYSIKIVNPLRRKEFQNIDLGRGKVYQSIKSMQLFISEALPNTLDVFKPDLESVEMGYVEPGHGMKGKKVWLYTDGDVKKMYEHYSGKPSICLWCYTCCVKKKDQPTTSTKESSSPAATLSNEMSYRRSMKGPIVLNNCVPGLT